MPLQLTIYIWLIYFHIEQYLFNKPYQIQTKKTQKKTFSKDEGNPQPIYLNAYINKPQKWSDCQVHFAYNFCSKVFTKIIFWNILKLMRFFYQIHENIFEKKILENYFECQISVLLPCKSRFSLNFALSLTVSEISTFYIKWINCLIFKNP